MRVEMIALSGAAHDRRKQLRTRQRELVIEYPSIKFRSKNIGHVEAYILTPRKPKKRKPNHA